MSWFSNLFGLKSKPAPDQPPHAPMPFGTATPEEAAEMFGDTRLAPTGLMPPPTDAYFQGLLGAPPIEGTDVGQGRPGGQDNRSDVDSKSAFLFGAWMTVSSSNVAAAQWDEERQVMTIEFHDGSFYEYAHITAGDAESFADAPSKGGWVWDVLRVRGTVFGFNPDHPYTHLSGPSQGKIPDQRDEMRRWMEDQESRQVHGEISQSGHHPGGTKATPASVRDLAEGRRRTAAAAKSSGFKLSDLFR